MTQPRERRRSPRIKADHEVVLSDPTEGEGAAPLVGRSVDINLNGIYCGLNRCMPMFTKLQINLRLPVVLREGGEAEIFELPLEAVVVRMDPETPDATVDHYHCALAFVNTDADAELVLARYLLQEIAHSEVVS
ncbi:MAG: hypothetical protein ACI9OJ_004611 [Myxococcota bacterium]|jgi:hypothetical protein